MFLKFHIVDHYARFKTIDFLNTYTILFDSLQDARASGNSVRLLPFISVHIFIIFTMFYVAYVYCNDFDPIQSFVYFDVVQLFGFKKIFNIGLLSLAMIVLYMYHKIYFDMCPVIYSGFKSILLDNPKMLFHSPYVYNGYEPIQLVKRKINVLLKYLNSFIITEGL